MSIFTHKISFVSATPQINPDTKIVSMTDKLAYIPEEKKALPGEKLLKSLYKNHKNRSTQKDYNNNEKQINPDQEVDKYTNAINDVLSRLAL